MADINTLKKGLIVTAFWEAKPGEVDALVGIGTRIVTALVADLSRI